jgi:hypothetical protein
VSGINGNKRNPLSLKNSKVGGDEAERSSFVYTAITEKFDPLEKLLPSTGIQKVNIFLENY